MLILNISKREREIIQSGNLHLLRDKLAEAEEIWKKKLYQGKEDHRYTQGISSLLSDLMEILPKN